MKYSQSIESRQREMLTMLAAVSVPDSAQGPSPSAITEIKKRHPSDPWEPTRQEYRSPQPWRSAIHKYTASLLLEVNAQEATDWFADPHNYVIGEWEGLIMLRAYHALKDNGFFISSGAEGKVRDYLVRELLPRVRLGSAWRLNPWGENVWYGSENHVIVQFSIRLLLEELAGPDMDKEHWNRAANLAKKWCWEKAVRGYTEYFSTHYSERSLLPLLNICDYSNDTNLKEHAGMAIDQLVAEHALVQINGFRGGAMRRFYQFKGTGPAQPELSDGRYDCFYPMGQTFFGDVVNSDPFRYNDSDQTIGYIFYATTSYRPSQVHLSIADPYKRGILEFKSARKWAHGGSDQAEPDAFIYAYITPHYILSSIRIPPGEIWGQAGKAVTYGVPYRLSFRNPRAMIGTARNVGDVHLNDPADAVAIFQYKNILLYSGKVDTYRDVYPSIPPNEGIQLEEREDGFRFFRERGAAEEEIYVGVREENGIGIMEACLARTQSSWDTFKSAFRNNSAVLNSAQDVQYTACDGTNIALHGSCAAVDGQDYPLQGWPLYESKLMKADWLNQSAEAGKITIGNEQIGILLLDFRDEKNLVRRETGVVENEPHRRDAEACPRTQ